MQNNDGSQKISGDKLKDLYKTFVTEYPIVSIEDPFDQDDWEHYGKMTAEIGEKVQIVGDDLLVTNPKVGFPHTISCSFLYPYFVVVFCWFFCSMIWILRSMTGPPQSMCLKIHLNLTIYACLMFLFTES